MKFQSHTLDFQAKVAILLQKNKSILKKHTKHGRV